MNKIETALVGLAIVMLMVVAVLLALLFTTGNAGAQEPTPCIGASWYDAYLLMQGQLAAQQPSASDDDEHIADKALNLYSLQFYLEALADAAPDCARPLLTKTAQWVGLQADFAMLTVLQSSGLGLPEESYAVIVERYHSRITAAASFVQNAYDSLYIVTEAE